MKTLQDLENEQAAERAKHAAQLALAATLPLVPEYIGTIGKRAPHVVYKRRTLTQALDLLNSFHIVPMYRFKDSCLQICPDGEQAATATDESGPYAIGLKVSSTSGKASAGLFFYSRASDGRLVHIGIDLEGPDYIGGFNRLAGSVVPVRTNSRGEVTEWRVGPNGALCGLSDSYVQWYSGSPRDGSHTYLFCADRDESGPWQDNAHAIGQLTNLRDEFQPEAELVETTAAASYWRFASGSYVITKPGERAPGWGHGYTLEFCKSVTEPKESSK